MPSHIDIQCGDYHAALVANEKAIAADRKYLEREGPLNFYTLSRTHNYHFKLYAAMFLGRASGDGTVMAVGPGTALITASVTAGDAAPVRVILGLRTGLNGPG